MLTQRTDISKLPIWEFTLNNLYDRFILPVLENKKTGHLLTDLDKIQPNLESDTIKRCSYEAYELIKKSKNRLKPENDGIVFQFEDFNKVESDCSLTEGMSIRDSLLQIVNLLCKETDTDTLSLSDRPKYYTKYKGYNGYMGWHTNSDTPGDRWYLVYNTKEDSSFFRYIDPNTNKMITKWEPKGWSLNHFKLGDYEKPLWHCIYTESNRISFGIRDIGSILKKHKWADVVVGNPNQIEENKTEELTQTEQSIQTLITACEIAQQQGAFTLDESRVIMNAIDVLNNSN